MTKANAQAAAYRAESIEREAPAPPADSVAKNRVTLELTHKDDGLPLADWPWRCILAGEVVVRRSVAESVRVVDDEAGVEKAKLYAAIKRAEAAELLHETQKDMMAHYVSRIEALNLRCKLRDRDFDEWKKAETRVAELEGEKAAAIRERDELREERERTNDKHQSYRHTALARITSLESQLESVADRAATAEERSESNMEAQRVIHTLTRQRDAAIRQREELRRSFHRSEEAGTRLVAERDASLDDAAGLRARVAELESQLESVADRAAAAETALGAAPDVICFRLLGKDDLPLLGDEYEDDRGHWHPVEEANIAAVLTLRPNFRRRVPAPAASDSADEEDSDIGYALRLFVDGRRVLSHELDRQQAGAFLIAAEHLAKYLRTEYQPPVEEAAPAASQWRRLDYEEIVQEGDEILWHNQWCEVRSVEIGIKAGEHAVPFRRRVCSPAATDGGLTPHVRGVVRALIGAAEAVRDWAGPPLVRNEDRYRSEVDGLFVAIAFAEALLVDPAPAVPSPGWLTEEERKAVAAMAAQAGRDSVLFDQIQAPDHAKAAFRRSKVLAGILARSPDAEARGWLTPDDRKAVEYFCQFVAVHLVCQFVAVHLVPTEWSEMQKKLRSLLARSTPPEVVLPSVYQHSSLGDPLVALEQVEAALAAAGVAWKVVR